MHRISALLLGSAGLIAAVTGVSAQDAEQIKRGEYLATAGDCVACHSAPGGRPFAGNYVLNTPIGKIRTPNLTPDDETGLGKWTADDFYRALHEGIDNEGSYLYPAFPFAWYTKVTRNDSDAIFAYLRSLEPVKEPRKPSEIPFPFNIRSALITWRTAFFTRASSSRIQTPAPRSIAAATSWRASAIAACATTPTRSSETAGWRANSVAGSSTAGTRPTSPRRSHRDRLLDRRSGGRIPQNRHGSGQPAGRRRRADASDHRGIPLQADRCRPEGDGRLPAHAESQREL